ncbi:MAG: hypothetical protein H0U83_07350 [Sphingomonas sp.]|jgi:hypothetical protein|nr:hypothetical protein [Sphingomonas sp.]
MSNSNTSGGPRPDEQSSSSQDLRQRAIEAYDSARDSASDAGQKAGDAIDESPLVALAAGIAAGALVAALLPVTRQEKKLLAPVGGRVASAARGAADAARQVGAEKLRELGLTPDSVAEKVTAAGRATAQAAIGKLRDERGKN